jgi:transcription-repair coupling factor (superfamily II helicase)
VKQQKAILYFISNPMSSFYQSNTFSKILEIIQSQPTLFQLKEKNNKLSLLIKNISSVKELLQILQHFYKHSIERKKTQKEHLSQ